MISTKHFAITYGAGILETQVSKQNVHRIRSLNPVQGSSIQAGLGQQCHVCPDLIASFSMAPEACPGPLPFHSKASRD